MPQQVHKIAVIGPESSGKTTLARRLAEYLHTLWLPEYAREYVENLQRPYTYADVEHIARRQPELERTCQRRANGLLFLDTELIITKVWFDEVFGTRPPWFDELLRQYHGDFYLLCRPDLGWTYDPVREYPSQDFRDYLFGVYQRELEALGFPYAIIEGEGDTRFKRSIEYVEAFRQHL